MKSFLSLVAALVVVGALAAGGYWLYQQAAGSSPGGSAGGSNAGGRVLSSTSSGASLTLTNGTHDVLTVTIRRETELVRFEIAPGHSQAKSLSAGSYSVEGKISDPKTDPFTSQWDFQPGGNYKANFAVDGGTGQVTMLLKASDVGKPASGTLRRRGVHRWQLCRTSTGQPPPQFDYTSAGTPI